MCQTPLKSLLKLGPVTPEVAGSSPVSRATFLLEISGLQNRPAGQKYQLGRRLTLLGLVRSSLPLNFCRPACLAFATSSSEVMCAGA